MHPDEIEKISIYSKHPTLEDIQNLLVVEPMNDIFKMVMPSLVKMGFYY